MKRITIPFLILVSLTLFLAACGGQTSPETAVPNLQATVDTSVMATTTAEEALQQVVDEAVDTAVNESIEAAAEEAVAEALAAATPEATYATYSEEELILLIEETAIEAETSSETYAQATETAVSDGDITAAEAEEIAVYVSLTEESLDELEAMIATYYALYGETGDEIVAELVAIEEELATLNDAVAEMTVILDEINDTLASGLVLAEESIAQLEQVAQQAQGNASDISTQMQLWATTAQLNASQLPENIPVNPEDLTALLQNVQPTEIADSNEEMITQLLDYANTANTALADETISVAEMQVLAQMSTNINASLSAQNAPQADALMLTINTLNMQMAQGDLQSARAGLGNLQTQMPTATDGGLGPRPGNRP